MMEGAGHVVITGTGRGIGAALAHFFLAGGFRVTGIDILDGNQDLQVHGRYAHEVADITDEGALDRALAAAWTRGPVGAVIANAAVTDPHHRHVVDLPYAVWRTVLRTNVDGAFLTARLAARRMLAGKAGNIIFVTSSLAQLNHALPGDAPYCASKAAVEMLAQVLSRELAADGINVNTLFPSVKVDTGFFAHLEGAERQTLAPPDILNEPALFLATLTAGALTGHAVDQELWDRDADYRRDLRRPI